uniref:Uncharacterized protein n=1 Tax=Micrurus lemniscatus lemniscatus TaxID=129467 RepID=A0A2D4JB30_MICLE
MVLKIRRLGAENKAQRERCYAISWNHAGFPIFQSTHLVPPTNLFDPSIAFLPSSIFPMEETWKSTSKEVRLAARIVSAILNPVTDFTEGSLLNTIGWTSPTPPKVLTQFP